MEILVEELHNHLYLKSFYTDVRWKSYTRGQTALPLVDFGDDVETIGAPSHLEASFHSSGRSTARLPRLSKLQRYLNYLSLRPSINPLIDEPVDDIQDGPQDDGASFYETGSFALPALGAFENPELGGPKKPNKNPELDSFAYIESLMESLACLGKLGYGLDSITQRVQGEMFTLVEGTVDEVGDRTDSTRLGTITARPSSTWLASGGGGGAGSGAMSEALQRGSLASLSSLSLGNSGGNRSSLLRVTASESTALESNTETLKDLFWTLYSKLDAVLQGFRVSYEVAMRIAEVCLSTLQWVRVSTC